jgi:ABC-type iron transport system FetAB ATPase subunit
MDAVVTTGPGLRVEGLRSALAGPFELTVAPGACVGITGASGSGKSLFLRMLCDLDVNEGDVWLDGEPRRGMAAPDWRRQVVYVPAESGWWTDRIADHFPKGSLAAVKEMATRLALPAGIVDGLVSRLSTGERQRLALTRALLMASPVLLLDEPTSALDQDSVGRVEAILKERLAAGLVLVLVTHDPAQAQRLAHQRYIMAAGRLEARS